MKLRSILREPYLDELQNYAPGVESTLEAKTIFPSIHTAEKTLASTIGDAVYKRILELDEDDEVKVEFKAALCNLVMYRYKIWEIVYKRQYQKQDTYKYELQMMQKSYIDNYYAHVDDLVKLLDGRQTDIPEWADSSAKKQVDGLLLKDAADFNSAYNIDNSYYFFFISIFIQQKVLDRYISPAIDTSGLDDRRLRRVKAVTAQLTVAYALRQFDFTFLPKSIRDSLADGAGRSGKEEDSAAAALAEILFKEATIELNALILDINKSEEGHDIESPSIINRECDKNYFMP